MFFHKYGLIIGGFLTIVGGLVTLYFNYLNNQKSDKKADKTLSVSTQARDEASQSNSSLIVANEKLKILSLENNGLKGQIMALKDENLQLHRELSSENKAILDNLTGGDSFPIIEFQYSTPNGVLKALGKVVGSNNLIIQEVTTTNVSGESLYKLENQEPLPMNPSPILHGNWKQGLNEAKYSLLKLSPRKLISGFERNLVEEYQISEFQKTKNKVTLEIVLVTQSKKFIQKTDLFLAHGFRGGGRWDDLYTVNTEVFDEKGNTLYKFENSNSWVRSLWD